MRRTVHFSSGAGAKPITPRGLWIPVALLREYDIKKAYTYLGQPWKTQQWVREIMDKMYRALVYAGMDDCGEMAAWYVWSAMNKRSVSRALALSLLVTGVSGGAAWGRGEEASLNAVPGSGQAQPGKVLAVVLENDEEIRSNREDLAQGIAEPLSVSGIYPHLAMWNNEAECGTGAVVPWQGKLYAVTYAPHKPNGSSDKLYIVSPGLHRQIFQGSVGGTPANRMIHRESRQLLIGPYLIDQEGNIRVIPPGRMFGRLTGNARHLIDPEHMVYYATMEEGLYAVDVHTLAVTTHIRDGNQGAPKGGVTSRLPGYHGKGLYSGQGRVVYANNGEGSPRARLDPAVVSGALAEWSGQGDWSMVRRSQFTEVTGPGGLSGNDAPETDPIWTMGWDARSLILGVLEKGEWSYYRLPKASHSYDGAHGWNTEWPRIRDIGEQDLLATMHGTFWSFPVTFSKAHSAGIAPRSNYLKVIGDFCRWNDRIVFGCDDSAKSEFLNQRPFKAEHGAARESNSSLWFVEPEQLDGFGPPLGRGAVWLNDDLREDAVSAPYLFSGYHHRMLHVRHTGGTDVQFALEVDRVGTDQWALLRTITVPANASAWHVFEEDEIGTWIRLKADRATTGVTAHFQYRSLDPRPPKNDPMFAAIARPGRPGSLTGYMRSQRHDTLGMVTGDHVYYELNANMELVRVDDSVKAAALIQAVAQPVGAYEVDAASVVVEEGGQRYRLPGNENYVADRARVCREVATERDLLNLHGTFYELPAVNAQGLAKIRPVATHNLAIADFCSHAGLLFVTGLDHETQGDHIFRSADGEAAVWAGVVDDLWKLGKPRGNGGPWKDTSVEPGVPSDPYLMTGYDRKAVAMQASGPTILTLEVDLDGTGLWAPYLSFPLQPGHTLRHVFPDGFSAYWVRARVDTSAIATVQFEYR